jgi:hypothetical protein
MNNEPLRLSLNVAVMLHVLDLEHRGGPTEAEIDDVREIGRLLAEKGDVLQFGGKPGEARDVFRQLAWGVAVLAFQPGGVRVFGDHYEGKAQPEVLRDAC